MLSIFNYEKDFSDTLFAILVLAVDNPPRVVRVLLESEREKEVHLYLKLISGKW